MSAIGVDEVLFQKRHRYSLIGSIAGSCVGHAARPHNNDLAGSSPGQKLQADHRRDLSRHVGNTASTYDTGTGLTFVGSGAPDSPAILVECGIAATVAEIVVPAIDCDDSAA